MTEPVGNVSGTRGTGPGGTYSGGGGFREEQRKKKGATSEGDLVEISQGARDRLSGKKRKTILEYLKDMLK